ncbi:hypothetical protein HF086_005824 [Spodoptera exigua]|uniref:Uncharacterized protein n=1 Tax=Spodoptera exigua TaxID=7107 RepID=A0A922M6Y6_SPOEX|nr:hypothetical protein HF086_005824 [Spodoptera exigua]
MFFTMKSVYLLVLVSLCQGLPLDSKAGLLSAPHLLRVNIIDPPAIEMTWNKIDSGDVKILLLVIRQVDVPTNLTLSQYFLGFKGCSHDFELLLLALYVKVWEVQNTTNTLFVVVDGKVDEIVNTEEQPIDILSELGGSPDEIQVPADVTTAVYNKVKMDITYEVRVLAYTKLEEGPLSDPVRVKLSKV